jgi:carboxylesterase type B
MQLQSGLLLLQLFSYVNSYPKLSQPVVHLEAGEYRGESYKVPENGNVGHKFLGIRYAAPAERFKVPQPAEKFDAVRDATNWAPACVQQFSCELEYHCCCLIIGIPD